MCACVDYVCGLRTRAQGRRYVGEAALAELVKREATVYALDNCHLLEIRPADLAGLPVDLSEIRRVICQEVGSTWASP